MEGKKRYISIRKIYNLITKHIRVYVIVCGVVFLLASLKMFTTPNVYTTSVSLAPESSSGFGGGAFSGLASLAGINLSGLGGADADAIFPEIYPAVVSSTPFMQSLLAINVVTKDSSFKGTLSEYLSLKKSLISFDKIFPSEEKKEKIPEGVLFVSPKEMKLIDKLRDNISVQNDKKTGMITMKCTFEDPCVAQIVGDSLSKQLQSYIMNYRTQKASNDLKFAQEFMEKSQKDYFEASVEYTHFADANIDLTLQEYKTKETFLENEMSTKYQIYTQAIQQVTLAQSKLQSKIPVYHVVQPSIVPVKKSGPKRTVTILFFVLLAFIGTTGYYYYIKEG